MLPQSIRVKLKVPAFRDGILISTATLLLLILGFTMHWSEAFVNFLYKNQDYPIDDFITTFAVMSGFLLLYGIRRNNEKRTVIANQILTEAALKKTQDNLQVLLKNSSSIVYNVEASEGFKLLYITENVASIMGYSKEEYHIPNWWYNLIHPDDRTTVNAAISELFKIGTIGFESRFKHKQGDWVWMHCESQLVYDSNGKPTEIVGTWWDITVQKAEQETTRQNNERVQLAFKATKDIIYDWDLATNALWMSDEIYHSYGYNKLNTFIDIVWWEQRIHPEDHDAVFADVMSAIDHKKSSWSGEYRFLCDDGSYKNIFDRGFIMYSTDRTPYRWIGSMSDITEQKTTEQLLLIANERFELASNASTDTIYDRNLITNEIWMSDEIFRSFGYPHQQHVKLEWWEEKIHPEDHDAVIQSVKDAILCTKRRHNWSRRWQVS